MSELFDRADKIFIDREMQRRTGKSRVDILLNDLWVAKSNVKTLQEMIERTWDSSGAIASKIALEGKRIERIESELELLGVTLEVGNTKEGVSQVLSNDSE